jgi:hypothetical protein
MPRKQRSKTTVYSAPIVDPADRNANSDHELVRHALVDIEEIAALPMAKRDKLVDGIVEAVRFYRTGLRLDKRGVSNRKVATSILLADIGRQMEAVGLNVTRWRKTYDSGRGESPFFRVVRDVAEVAGIEVPKDLKRQGQNAAKIEYL